jgi:hypothetical protein
LSEEKLRGGGKSICDALRLASLARREGEPFGGRDRLLSFAALGE